MRWLRAASLSICLLGIAVPVQAQDQQTLADIRQELNVLFVEIQRLKRELSTTGAPGVAVTGGSVLDRVTSIESELQRLTARTEELEFRVESVVRDGTNRIGDLEFRLVELEGGDVSQLSETTTLGGDAPANPTPAAPPASTSQSQTGELALGEEADFNAAKAALEAGQFKEAAEKFATFNQSYPGSPLAAQASLQRGTALNGLGDTREAARAFLESYTTNPTGPSAPEAVVALGTALGKLGKTQEACVTLGEVPVRYPNTPAVANAQKEMATLGCS
ncbi:tol-pal system protein YbgF [Thalassococcus sp. S3]|uniref:tol-pal system protein YbgF n=1 Tax=Thalassococcus sp. S3 TaxID=2017482 RepID=UPI00102468EF|nr:tol-pal system protein YbgF [Thalassococcus sp. S3]QBF32972.1 tol-pal system protein YbgF [Thalassococcus sp. S3]